MKLGRCDGRSWEELELGNNRWIWSGYTLCALETFKEYINIKNICVSYIKYYKRI